MGSLTTCLKKAGDLLAPEVRVSIMERAAALRKDGVKAQAAASQAIDEQLEEVRELIAQAAKDLINAKKRPAADASISPDVDQAQAVSLDPLLGVESDIPAKTATAAFSGTSFDPDRRGASRIEEYVAQLRQAWGQALKAAGDDQQAVARAAEVMSDVREGFKQRVLAYLAAHGRVMSSMIAGPARFPVERNRKRSETADRRASEAQEYLQRGIKRMERAARGPIDNSPDAELERVRLNLTEREENQERMKAANAALRKGDDEALRDMDFTDEEIAGLKQPDAVGRAGFPDYKLANNNAEIRRLRERLASAEARVEAAAAGPVERQAAAGVRIEENARDDRLRLFFDNKPSAEVREALKSAAFKWSPNAGAWQRQLTNNARSAARDIVAKFFPSAAEPRASRAAGSTTANVLRALSENDELFQLPKSTAVEVDQIAADHNPNIKVQRVTSIPGETRYNFTLPSGKTARMVVRRANPYGHPTYGFNYVDGEMSDVMNERPGRDAETVDPATEDLWIDVSLLEQGDEGRTIYSIASTYAHNTGRIFVGDPAGLSNEAMRRRPEQMLSSALKWGTTRHLAPHPRQVAGDAKLGVPALDWKYGDDLHNISELIRVNLAVLKNAGADGIEFDPSTGQFLDDAGQPLDRDGLALVAKAGYGRSAGAGASTLARGSILRALSREAGGADGSTDGRPAGLLAALLRQSAVHQQATAGLFYSREPQGLSRREAEAILGALPQDLIDRLLGRRPSVETLREAIGKVPHDIDVAVVQSVDDLPPEQRKKLSALEPGGRVRGVYFPDIDRTWLIADHLHSEAEAVFVMLHEAFHRGLAKTFGADAKRVLRQMYHTNGRLQQLTKQQMQAHGIGQDEAIEEALADLAGQGKARDLKGWQRLVDIIRGWLSAVGRALGLDITWSDEMIEDFVAGARAAGLRGEPHANPAAADASISQVALGEQPVASRAADGMAWLRDQQLPLGYKVNDFLSSSGKVGWWHKTVGTMHNLAERSPPFKRVYDAAQRFLNDVSLHAREAADLAPDLLPKLESLRDLWKSPLSAEDTRAIAGPIFEGTLRWTRDDTGEVVKADDVGTAGVVWTDDELRSRFKANDKQVALYRQFRASVDRSLTDLAVSDMLRFGGSDVEAVRAAALAAGDVTQAAQLMSEHLAELASKSGKDRAATLADTGAKILEKAQRARDLMARGYAPLSRFGHYTLDVTEGDERVYFGLFESEADANRMARQMRKQHPGAKVEQGTMSDEKYRMFSGVSPETLELFGEMLGLETRADDAASQAFQQYLKLAKSNRSAMKRLIERKGIEGFSEDAGRVLAGFVYSNARQTAKNLHMGEMGRAVQAIAEEKGQGELLDAAVRLHQYITNPQEEGQAIKGLMFTQFLGGSIAAGLVNMTQPFMVTFPYLSQFGGVASAAARMSNAVRDAVRDKTGDAALDAALKRAEEEGVVSPQEVHSLIAQAKGAGALKAGDGTAAGDAAAKASNFMSKLMLAWGRPFALAEQFNRRVTFIAAYRTAVAEKMDDPAAFAERVILETQFNYSKANRPNWARGAVGGALFTFKTYSISYVELLSRLAASGPEGKRAALVALAVLVLVSGLDGLPGAGDMEDIIDGLLQRLGYNFSTKQAKREFLAGIVGDGGAQFLTKGMSGLPGAPIDVAGRLGLGNLVPGTGLLLKKPDHGSDVAELMGPAGSLARQAATAAGQLVSGNVREAATAVLPVAAANVVKAYDMASMGMYRDTKGRKVLDTDGFDAFVKAIGFQPADVAKVQQAAGEVQRTIDLVKMRETEIADRWARGVFERDRGEVAAARAELAQWNADNPDARIAISDGQIVKRVKAMGQSRQDRVAATAPKEIRAQVKRELEPAR